MSKFIDKEVSKVISKNGVFFAFSNDQFLEGKKEGVEYVSIGAGGFCPAENLKGYIAEMDESVKVGMKQDVETNGPAAIIKREYFNYECQITMDTSDMIDALDMFIKEFPSLFTDELINKTAKECFQEAVDKDLF